VVSACMQGMARPSRTSAMMARAVSRMPMSAPVWLMARIVSRSVGDATAAAAVPARTPARTFCHGAESRPTPIVNLIGS
jgi:hypothetical protein